MWTTEVFRNLWNDCHTHSLYTLEEVRCLVACMPPVVGSSLILGLLHQSWQQRDLLSLVQATKIKRKHKVIIWNCLKEVCRYRLIESDSPLFWRLISVAGKKIYVTFILFHSFLWFRSMPECCHNDLQEVAEKVCQDIVSHYITWLCCLVFSCHFLSCLVL